MSELLAISVTLNLFLMWRLVKMYAKYRMSVKLMVAIAEGKLSIHAVEDGFELKAVKTTKS